MCGGGWNGGGWIVHAKYPLITLNGHVTIFATIKKSDHFNKSHENNNAIQ